MSSVILEHTLFVWLEGLVNESIIIYDLGISLGING